VQPEDLIATEAAFMSGDELPLPKQIIAK